MNEGIGCGSSRVIERSGTKPQRRGGRRTIPRTDEVVTWAELVEAWLIRGLMALLLLV